MRRIKKEIFDRLTDFEFNLDAFRSGRELRQDFVMIGDVGAHERKEAIDALVECSIENRLIDPKNLNEIKEKIETLINYLEFHHYFYGVSSLPACLCFCEDENKQLATFSKCMETIKWNEYKSFLRDNDPKAVLIHAVVFEDGEWVIRMKNSDIKLIYDNPSYIEYYKPNKE